MTTIVTRTGKGSSLSWEEADANFTNLNTDKLEAGFPASQVANIPAGGISATTVQTAINELDTEKVSFTRLDDSDGSSLVGFIQTGTGTVLQTLQNKAREFVSVKDFGAIGDGVTDDQSDLTAAIAHCYTVGDWLFWPDGTYVSSSSIPNFHNVHHFGPGILKRGTDLFNIYQPGTTTNRIYLATTGDNANDGLSASQPMLTFQNAFTTLKNYGPVLPGVWEIIAAAGTYSITAGQHTHDTPSRYRVVIRGPVAGHPNVPTCIVDGGGSGTSYNHGIGISQFAYAEVRDIKFSNFVGSNTRNGLVGEHESDLYTDNVHADSCDWAGILGNNAILRVKGGILNNCRSGVVVNGNEYTIGYRATSTADSTQITNSSQSGIYVSRCARGHADYCQLTSNAIGLECDTNGRVHMLGSDLKLNTIALRTVTGGIVTESSNVYNDGTGNANTTKYDFKAFSGSNLFLQSAYAEICVALDTTTAAHTGTTTKTTVRQPYTIPANLLTENNRKLRVKIHGTGQVTGGTVVGIGFGGTTINSCTVTGAWGAGLAWIAEIDIWATGTAGQRSSMVLSASNLSPRHGNQAGSVNMTTDKTLDVEITLANAADTVSVNRVEVFMVR